MNIKSRLIAFTLHLGISAIIFILLASIIRFSWYPGVFFSTEGGWQGIRLIAGVDLIIGPLLTLIIYNPLKKELKRDLSIIGILQASCIIVGMHIVEKDRPIAVIYVDGIYYTATRAQYYMNDIDYKQIGLLQQSWPAMIALDVPEDKQKRRKTTIKLHSKSDIRIATDLYLNYWENLERLDKEGLDYSKSKQMGIAVSHKSKIKGAKIFNLITRYGHYHILVDTKKGKILKRLDNAR